MQAKSAVRPRTVRVNYSSVERYDNVVGCVWAGSDGIVNGALPTVTESWRRCYDSITTDKM